MERVLVAMSGGVDSSVAAALLLRQGYEVVGCMGVMHDARAADASDVADVADAGGSSDVGDVAPAAHAADAGDTSHAAPATHVADTAGEHAGGNAAHGCEHAVAHGCGRDSGRGGSQSGPSESDIRAARDVASRLGIPFHVFDLRECFEAHVVGPFCESYCAGRTPSPCIECNRYVKFGALQEKMRELGCSRMATGHYARIVARTNADADKEGNAGEAGGVDTNASADSAGEAGGMRKKGFCTANASLGDAAPATGAGSANAPAAGPAGADADAAVFELRKAKDTGKDQSYMLAALSQDQIAHTLLPLGDYTKAEVRAMARDLGFRNAQREESQDICFVPDGDYAAFIEARCGTPCAGLRRGRFVDTAGTTLGEHNGIARYTIGQRKGIGLAFGEPRYVCALDPQANTVTLGTADELASREVRVRDFTWIAGTPPVGCGASFECRAKLRYRQTEQPAVARIPAIAEGETDGSLLLVFDEPQRAVAPGQYAVLYDGTRVLGAGVIARD